MRLLAGPVTNFVSPDYSCSCSSTLLVIVTLAERPRAESKLFAGFWTVHTGISKPIARSSRSLGRLIAFDYSAIMSTAQQDPLGEALHFLRMSGVSYCRSDFTSPWGLFLPYAEGCARFHLCRVGSRDSARRRNGPEA